MLLSREGNVGGRQPFLAERVGDDFRLVGWHDRVLQTLEENDGRGDLVDRMNRGSLAIDVTLLGPASDQALVIHRLELVRVGVKDLEVADAIVAGARPEEIRGRQGAEDGVATGTAA